ncbi:MAG: flagellar hook-basal body protein, partial [Cyanobacteria bacterium NC_groundwater_1444_Ag_S-0.65um_54_12]|nr:flagellar hook-basal body protein [Cyanobacteria bacterium NC_groundwater_1444_Ag_S-0.65um_54_12]
MIRGIYAAASGMVLQMQTVDVLAHNLANAATNGYKRREAVAESFGDLVVDILDSVPEADNKTGAGVRLAEVGRDERSGNLRPTGNPLDLGLISEGHYFVTQRRDGTRLLTRDGQFYLDDQLHLVTAQRAYVLDAAGNPLVLKEDLRNIKIREDGTILGAEAEIGKLLVVALSPAQLPYFPLLAPNIPPAEKVVMKQGYLETSNVNIITELVSLVE